MLVRLESIGAAVEPERPGLVCFDARGLLRLSHRALARARALAGEDGVVLATGSIYLISDLMRPEGSRGGSTL